MTATLSPDVTMQELLQALPGAQRALFRLHHIGGCASCGFRPDETLAEVCARNDALDPVAVLAQIELACAEDARMLMEPRDAAVAVHDGGARLLDIRTREEFDAVHLPQSQHFTQDLLQAIMAGWPKDDLLILIDHQGARSLDAAAYFAGHGFTNVRGLRGGIDAWSLEVDPTLPRYTVE
ncbi:MAG: rhodanese-like domain-containing protein [Terrimicrobiaceae bacterium]|nr:rhodanese-like domain-containing protein [Terrimicrobiaceae bacterium]